eukprot:CAMPEP_0172473402 /NCGR_PEP_ID=MMETSP1065-20121228/68838_1 /TAXON_ID=265537 /ORGANISM="Amphiprora paludosa, Strain CCMP125" /LENGTH=459 /DNA_ID=CAMNT_0013231577 /DNA_START=84 /DNA_END=1463 /DNA_ORIENTATION=-
MSSSPPWEGTSPANPTASTLANNPLLSKDPFTGFRPSGYYFGCLVGGLGAGSISHTLLVPWDVAKVRAQACAGLTHTHGWPSWSLPSLIRTWNSEGWTGLTKGWAATAGGYGLHGGLKFTWNSEGWTGLTKGWAATAGGYGLHGGLKFGLTEALVDLYTQLLWGGDRAFQKAETTDKLLLWAAASASAESVATVALCPFEMTKVKQQVTLPGEVKPISNDLQTAWSDMRTKASRTHKFPLGIIRPLLFRQIPHTMIQFVGFYQIRTQAYKELEKSTGKRPSDFETGEQLAITFFSGYCAGILSAVTTQPMDNLISFHKFPLGIIRPLLFRQIPHTMIQFVGFYQIRTQAYKELEKSTGKRPSDFETGEQLAITFFSGYCAGILSAVTTQPMDNLVSLTMLSSNRRKSFSEISSEAGFQTLRLRGLGSRIFMIGTLTGVQWWIYDSFRNLVGFGPSSIIV